MEIEMTLQHLRAIECVDDEEARHIVDEYQEITETKLLSGEISRTRGLKEMRLRSGDPVNYIDEDTFEIVKTGTIIHRV